MYCFSKLCRVCLRDDRPLINIYSVNEDNVRICDILSSVKPDMITMNNSLPPWICITCKKQLRRAYKFQKKCNKSLKTFIHYLSLLKCGKDENEAQQILNVQITDILHDNADEKKKQKKKCEDVKNDAQEPIKSENFSEDNSTGADQTDSRWNSAAFCDFTSDFICELKETFKFKQDSDADSESTVILDLNSIVNRIDVLNNKDDDLIGISELDATINVLSNLQSEQSNIVNTFVDSSENNLKVDNFINSASELDKHLNSVIDIIQEISTDFHDLNKNSVLPTSANNETLGFNSGANKSNNILSNNKSNPELDCTTNVHFNANTILHNEKSDSDILLNPVNIKSENNEPNEAETTEVTVKDESAFANTTIELNEESKYIFELDLTSTEESNNLISLNTDQMKNENEQIKVENDDTQKLLFENDKSVTTFCNINSTSDSTELHEEQKFVFELDFTGERDFNTDLPLDLKTKKVSLYDFDNVEQTELLSKEKEDTTIMLNNEETQILNLTSNLVCSTYENVQDMLTIEKTELPFSKSEDHADLTTEDIENRSNTNNFPLISVKTADTINSTIMSPSSMESSSAKSVLLNQFPNENNSRVINKNASKFSIANLLNSSPNLHEQNKRSINHSSNTIEAKTNTKQCFDNDLVIIIDDDSSDRDIVPLKRRKIGLSENRINYGENVVPNTEIARKTVYNGSIYNSTNSAEYIDMDEHMRNNFNSIRNFTQPPLPAHSTHALNDNYSKSSSHNVHNTNYYAVNAHTVKVNHNSYKHMSTSNIQSTVSNRNQNTYTSNMYQNIQNIGLPNMPYQTSNSAPYCNANSNYNRRFNATPYQATRHNPNFPIDTNSITRNDYLSHRSTNQQYPTHYRNLPPKNVLFHTLTNTTNLHQNISSQSCNTARPMSNENRVPHTERIANPLQNSTAIIPQRQKEFTLDEKRASLSDTQAATNEHTVQCSDQKDSMDENIDNRPASRSSQISSSTSSISSNSNADSAEGSSDSTVNKHFYTFFTNMETASAYLHTSVEGVVENEADELMFLVDKNKSVYICKKCCHHFPCISELYIHSEEHIDEFDYQTMIYRTRDHAVQSDCINFVIIEDIKLFVCGKCDMEFADKTLLLAHVRGHVPNVVVTEVNLLVCNCQNCIAFSGSQTGRTDFKCGKCDKTFLNAENLRVHGFIHFLEKPAKCPICNRNFKDKSRLNDHNFRMHTPKLECDVCKKLIRPDLFENHQLVHQNPDHKCDICGKKYLTRPRLLLHQRIHGDEKPFACKYCDKKFLHKMVLDNHERVHTGEKPYKCEVCKKCFSQQTSVQVHMRIHTGEKPYKCKDCGKCYTQSYVYKQHRKKHHPPSTP